MVLAEFTGGFPEQILTKDYNRNFNVLWSKLMGAYENHYLLAAGSPGGTGSDTKCSKLGIIQGHAYSVY